MEEAFPDNSIKKHTLLQAIARVNRIYDMPYKTIKDVKEVEKTRTKVTQLTSKIIELAKIHYKKNDWSKD